jgi:hypothetical protein
VHWVAVPKVLRARRVNRLPLSRPGALADALYLLVALAPPAAAAPDSIAAAGAATRQQRRRQQGHKSCMSPGHDRDGELAECGARTLARLGAAAAASDDARPFFFGVGLHKPHVPPPAHKYPGRNYSGLAGICLRC